MKLNNSIIYQYANDLMSIFDNKDLYPSLEEKASNKYNLLIRDNNKVIDNNTLVAITILIAESNPSEKDILIDLVMNFLTEK